MSVNYYQVLEVTPQATQVTIKQAYRRLAKRFHPDRIGKNANTEQIILINAAYEILSDPKHRRLYDQQLLGYSPDASKRRQQRTAQAQTQYYRNKPNEDPDIQLQRWLRDVYKPVNRIIQDILQPLEAEVDELSADPFDDELMVGFQDYVNECREYLNQAQSVFVSQPNPTKVAGAAANLYYCLNQISDALDELEWFTLNYDEGYLHTGLEMFRIAWSLRYEAQQAIQV